MKVQYDSLAFLADDMVVALVGVVGAWPCFLVIFRTSQGPDTIYFVSIKRDRGKTSNNPKPLLLPTAFVLMRQFWQIILVSNQ